MKILHHIIFWIMVYIVLTLIMADWFMGYVASLYFVSMLMPVVMGTSYFFNYFLVPRYLFRKRIGLFLLYSFYMLVVSLCAEMVVAVLSMIITIHYAGGAKGALITDVYLLAGVLYFIVLTKSFILLIRRYFSDQKAIGRLEEKQEMAERGYFTVRSNRQTSRIPFEEVLYIESLADYIKIHLAGGQTIQSKEKISHMEETLPVDFIRIHRSFLVYRPRISSFNREAVQIGEIELPLSRSYKKVALEKLSLQGS